MQRFLAELADVSRQADPRGMQTYASYPPTHFLQLPFLDFVTFNLYLRHPLSFHAHSPSLGCTSAHPAHH
jgi:O-antigen biosynthesis protein